MRIALFADTYPPTVNGVARALGLLVQHARRGGHQVGLISPPLDGSPAPGTAFHARLPGVRMPMYPELRAARPWLGRQTRRQLRALRPDLAHVATEGPVGYSGRRWALARGVPLVTSYCTNFPYYVAGYGLGWAEEILWHYLRRFHRPGRFTFAPSETTLRELRRRGFHDRLRVWSRGVDAQRFHPRFRSPALRRELAPGGGTILLYVGRVAPEKRIDLLMDAFGVIREAAAERVTLVVVGDGPSLANLRRRGTPDVRFTGYRTGAALSAHYASADLLLFPSDTETFGQVVTEAMASGIPVVAPARGGVVDTVTPGRTGALFEPGNAGAMARAALDLIAAHRLRRELGIRARHVASHRSWASVFDRLFEHYAEVCWPRGTIVTKMSQAQDPEQAIF